MNSKATSVRLINCKISQCSHALYMAIKLFLFYIQFETISISYSLFEFHWNSVIGYLLHRSLLWFQHYEVSFFFLFSSSSKFNFWIISCKKYSNALHPLLLESIFACYGHIKCKELLYSEIYFLFFWNWIQSTKVLTRLCLLDMQIPQKDLFRIWYMIVFLKFDILW